MAEMFNQLVDISFSSIEYWGVERDRARARAASRRGPSGVPLPLLVRELGRAGGRSGLREVDARARRPDPRAALPRGPAETSRTLHKTPLK